MMPRDELRRIAERELACTVPPTSHRLAQGVIDLLGEIGRREAALYAMIDCLDGAVHNHDDRGKGGQHVSYHGDFANMPPSSVGQMRRWSRDLRAAIAGVWPMTRCGGVYRGVAP